jgi:hypothetical protein
MAQDMRVVVDDGKVEVTQSHLGEKLDIYNSELESNSTEGIVEVLKSCSGESLY